MDLVKLSKDHLYLDTEEMKCVILKHCCSAIQLNRQTLLITTTAHITWLFVISLQDPFYSVSPPKKRHLWALPEATQVIPIKSTQWIPIELTTISTAPLSLLPALTVQFLMLNLKLFFFFNLLYILLHISIAFSQDLD